MPLQYTKDHTGNSATDFHNRPSLYRKVLSSQADSSVTIITVGYLVEKTDPAELARIIDALMLQPPTPAP